MKNGLSKKIHDLLKHKECVYIFPSLKQDSIFAALALFYSLKNNNQKVNLVVGRVPLNFQKFGSETPSFKEPSLVINPPSSKHIKQLKYNKESGKINLFFDTQKKRINPKDFSFRFDYDNNPDLFITIGAKNPAHIKHPYFQDNYKKIPVVNIDNQKDNSLFGEVNFVDEEYKSLSMQIINLFKDEEFPILTSKPGAYLLQGVRLMIDSLKSNEVLKDVSYLLEHQSLAYAINPVEVNNREELSVLQKSIRQLQIWPNDFFFLNLSSLSKKEFKEKIKIIVKELHAGLFNLENLVILHEGEKKVQGILYSNNEKVLEKIASSYQSNKKHNKIIFNSEDNLKSVEKYLLTLIKKYE